MTNHTKSLKFSPEVRDRPVRMVLDHVGSYPSQWSAIASIAAKIGCTGQTLSNLVKQTERDAGLGWQRRFKPMPQPLELFRECRAFAVRRWAAPARLAMKLGRKCV